MAGFDRGLSSVKSNLYSHTLIGGYLLSLYDDDKNRMKVMMASYANESEQFTEQWPIECS